MKRRMIILGGLAAGLAVAGSASVLRWHATPGRQPLMTDAHLAGLSTVSGSGPRVLFVGNSMVLRNDLPAQVERLARASGVPLRVATAAARGMRLVEALRIEPFRQVLKTGWDALVLQDFSTVSLRAPDRWGSAYAMQTIAAEAQAKAVTLYPTWAFPPSHPVYRTGGGMLSSVPANPATFAAAITDHYDRVADKNGWGRAAVTEAFLPDATAWLDDDLHHPNEAGTARAADEIWKSLRAELAQSGLI